MSESTAGLFPEGDVETIKMATGHIKAEGKGVLICNMKSNDSFFYAYKVMKENLAEDESDDDDGKIFVKQMIDAVESCDFNAEVIVFLICDRGNFYIKYNLTDLPE